MASPVPDDYDFAFPSLGILSSLIVSKPNEAGYILSAKVGPYLFIESKTNGSLLQEPDNC